MDMQMIYALMLIFAILILLFLIYDFIRYQKKQKRGNKTIQPEKNLCREEDK